MREREQCHRHIDRRGDISRKSHVVDAQQVESGQDAARHRAGDIGAIEQSQPGNSPRRGFHPARDGGKRGAHQERRRKQADRGNRAAQDQPGESGEACARDVKAPDQGNAEQRDDPERRDPQFQKRVDAHRMMPRRNQPRESDAAQAQPAHVSREQQSQRYGRGADHQLQQLKPDDLVNQRRATAAGKQQEPGNEIAVAAFGRLELRPGLV